MSMFPIASASNTYNVVFASIPQTFTHLQIRVFGRDGGSGFPQDIYMRFNGDSGSNYSRHRLIGDGSSASALGQTSVSYIECGLAPVAATTANVESATIVDIFDYANTNKNKTIRSLNGLDVNGSGYVGLFSGAWLNTAAITSIEIGFASGVAVAGNNFQLYGIQSSPRTGA